MYPVGAIKPSRVKNKPTVVGWFGSSSWKYTTASEYPSTSDGHTFAAGMLGSVARKRKRVDRLDSRASLGVAATFPSDADAWAMLVEKLGTTACAGLKAVGAVAFVQEAGVTAYLPPGWGHWVWTIRGDVYTTAGPNGATLEREIAISLVVWHTPRGVRADITQMIEADGDQEAQLQPRSSRSRRTLANDVRAIRDTSPGPLEADCDPVADPSRPCIWLDRGKDDAHFMQMLSNVALSHSDTNWGQRNTLDAPYDDGKHQLRIDEFWRSRRGQVCDDEQSSFSKNLAKLANRGRSNADKLNWGGAVSMFVAKPTRGPLFGACVKASGFEPDPTRMWPGQITSMEIINGVAMHKYATPTHTLVPPPTHPPRADDMTG